MNIFTVNISICLLKNQPFLRATSRKSKYPWIFLPWPQWPFWMLPGLPSSTIVRLRLANPLNSKGTRACGSPEKQSQRPKTRLACSGICAVGCWGEVIEDLNENYSSRNKDESTTLSAHLFFGNGANDFGDGNASRFCEGFSSWAIWMLCKI